MVINFANLYPVIGFLFAVLFVMNMITLWIRHKERTNKQNHA